jgi:hypothetical protein
VQLLAGTIADGASRWLPVQRESENMRKSLSLLVMVGLVAVVAVHCSDAPRDTGEVLVHINDFNLSLDEFETKLVAELEFEEDYKLTYEARRAFLEQLVRKELMIQEAQRLKLDHREKFIRAIERYWESTLIRDLVELKGEEFSSRAYVSEEAIVARYERTRAAGKNLPPIDEVREEIREVLVKEEKEKKMAEWLNELESKADIRIDEALLKKE